MKTEESQSIHFGDVYIERIVRHIRKGQLDRGTVRYQMKVWNVQRQRRGVWNVTGLANRSYFAGGRLQKVQ